MAAARLPAVNGARVVRLLTAAGFVVDRIVGSHRVLKHPADPVTCIQPGPWEANCDRNAPKRESLSERLFPDSRGKSRRCCTTLSLGFIRYIQRIARMAQLSGFSQRALFDEVLQIPCRGGARSLRDADIIFSAQPALESVDAFAEHAGDRFVLALIQLATQLLVELRLCDVKIETLDRIALRFKDRLRKIRQPLRDLDVRVVAFKRGVVSLA